MKKYSFLFAVLLFAGSLLATPKDSTIYYNLPDSVKAVQFMAELDLANIKRTKSFRAGVTTSIVSLSILKVGKVFQISFNCLLGSNPSQIITGNNVQKQEKRGHLFFPYTMQSNEKYKLLISLANDSVTNASIYSGYVFLPRENKWKLIGSFKFNNRWHYIQDPSVFIDTHKKSSTAISLTDVLVQRNRDSWKNLLKQEETTPPIINLYSHLDSLQQRYIETKQIQDSIAAGKTDATKSYNGIYFTMLKEGTGPQVLVTDTVVAHYKGYLFSDGTIFDQTKDKPATFPLNHLIKGWQMGLPLLCRVGGKIKLLIPSDLAYSIRTRAAKIPPNSILVFEIEVLEVKSAN